MFIPRFVATFVSIILMCMGAATLHAQDYPSRPIRIITASIGGGSDFTARLIANALIGPLGQQVVVVNYPSGGNISADVASKAAPDGYSLFVGSNSFWLAPLIYAKVLYDPFSDFLPISAVARSPSFLVVHPSVPAKTVKEFIALAKARPGELNYSSGTAGGADHLAAELFKSMTGVNLVRIVYKTTSLQTSDLIAGHVQLSFATGGTAGQHIKSGKLRALGITSAQRSAVFPTLPTIAESGVPGYESEQILGVWAPAKTAAPIITRLNQEIVRALATKDLKDKFLASGVETIGTSPEQFAVIIKSDFVKLGKVIKEANIHAD